MGFIGKMKQLFIVSLAITIKELRSERFALHYMLVVTNLSTMRVQLATIASVAAFL